MNFTPTPTGAPINTALVLHSKRERDWQRHARAAQATAWLALVMGLPATLGGVWSNGAGLFCF
jgi:hypothetical protein